MLRSGKMLGLAAGLALILSAPLSAPAFAGDRPTRTPIPLKDHSRPTRTPIDFGERTRKPTNPPTPTRTPPVLRTRTAKPTERPTATRTPPVKEPNLRPPTKTLRPTRTPIVIEQRPTKAVPPTRTPMTVVERTRKPTVARVPTRTPIVKQHPQRPPTQAPRPTRTPIVIEARPEKPTRTLAPTRTPIGKEHRERPPTQAPRPTRTPLTIEDRPEKATKTPRPTRTPLVKQHVERPPTKTQRPTRTPVVKDHPDRPTRTPMVFEERPTKTARPTRTPIVKEHVERPPTQTPRPTRTALVIEQREGKPTKTPRPTRTPIVKEHAERPPTKEPRPTRTAKVHEPSERPPTKEPRPTRTPVEKEHGEREPTKPPRPTRTPIPTKTATPIPQFNPANVTASCRAILKKDVTVTLTVMNRSGTPIFDVRAGALQVQRAPGTNFVLGPAPSDFTRVNNGSNAIFRWRGSFRSSSGACGFSVTAHARGPAGEIIDLPLTDCGTVVLGHGLAEADLVPDCGSGAGEGGALGCGEPGTGPGSGALPDLTVDTGALGSSVMFQTRNFPAGDCALVEGCVSQPGIRRLMRFSTVTPNVGAGDVFFGDPRAGGNFIYSACHQHYHFNGYASYRLLGSGGQVVASGHKQAFCLIDLEPIRSDAGPPKYHCLNQGISAGWADVYDRQLDCQWIDITDVAPGSYTLEVIIDPGNIIRESDDGNNVGRVSVTIPPQ